MEKVSVLKVTSTIEKILEQILENLRVDIDLTEAEKIIIKPNLCNYQHPSTGATTDVRVIDALIELISTMNEKALIYIVESDSYGKLADIAFKLLGYKSLEEKYDSVTLVNLTKEERIKKTVNGFYFTEFDYPKIFTGEHFFISVPKLKTLDVDYMTCALKNQYGCNPYPEKWIYHKNLSEVIYDLNKLFTPDLIMVDGIISMEGFGPADGIPKRTNLVIGGRSPVCVDVIAAEVMGISPKKVRHLKFALKHGGLGSDDVKVIGNDLSMVKEKFILPKKTILARILKV